MLPFLHDTIRALQEIMAAIAQAGARAHAGNLVLSKITSLLQKACPVPAQRSDLLAIDAFSACCAKAATSVSATGLLCCDADPAGGGPVLPSRGRELPVCGVHVAAAGARLLGAGAQPVRGGGGVAAGRAQAEAVPGAPQGRPACTAGATDLRDVSRALNHTLVYTSCHQLYVYKKRALLKALDPDITDLLANLLYAQCPHPHHDSLPLP